MTAKINEIVTSEKEKRGASIRRLRPALSHHTPKRAKFETKRIAEAKAGAQAKTPLYRYIRFQSG